MTAFTTPIKRKLTKKEAIELKVFKRALRYLKAPYWGGTPCKDFLPSCPNCRHFQLIGFIEEYIMSLEF